MSADAGNPNTLDRAVILGIVRDQLAEILEKSPDDILEDVPFTDLGADSLALIELVEALDENLATLGESVPLPDIRGQAHPPLRRHLCPSHHFSPIGTQHGWLSLARPA